MQYLICRLLLVGFMPLSVVACAADLPADERMAIVEDSLRANAALDSLRALEQQVNACLEAYNAQFHPLAMVDSVAADSSKDEIIPPELRQAVVDYDYEIGEDPDFARTQGWPVAMPRQAVGSILPCRRVVAYYGNPRSRRMGVLGEYPRDEMLRRFQAAVAEWNAADPQHPVTPALHLIVSVAQPHPGRSGLYRNWMPDSLIEEVYSWARSAGAITILDLQIGQSTVQAEIPRIEHFLRRPDVHLALDPEFAMRNGRVPGQYVGSLDAADINWASEYLASLVREHGLPPKLLVIHRFTRPMVTNASAIQLRPEVQIIMDMDGWGAPHLKRSSYHSYVVREPVQFTGFKIFYHNDRRGHGRPIMTPADVLRLRPQPLYIQYQ